MRVGSPVFVLLADWRWFICSFFPLAYTALATQRIFSPFVQVQKFSHSSFFQWLFLHPLQPPIPAPVCTVRQLSGQIFSPPSSSLLVGPRFE